jgi:HlyD family secretion protein
MTKPSALAKHPLVKPALVGALGLAILAAFTAALWPRPVPIDSAPIARGPLTVTVDEEGKSRIRDVYVISAPTSGRILRSTLKAGHEVLKGQVVAVIEPGVPPFLDLRGRRELEAVIEAARAAVRLAEAELAAARTELAYAERELARSIPLSKSQVIPERQLEKARLDAETRKAALARAEANRELRWRELESAIARRIGPEQAPPAGADENTPYVSVGSPIGGRVLKVLQESEHVVAQGTPLVEIGDPQNLELVVELLSNEAVRVRPGARAAVEGWGGLQLGARVERIEPAGFTKVSALGIEEQRVRVILALEGDPAERTGLGHDYRVLVRIVVEASADALLVPTGALFRKGDAWAVFTVAGGRARTTLIEVGARNNRHAEVLEGLEAGARVILHPSDRVVEGVRVAERRG